MATTLLWGCCGFFLCCGDDYPQEERLQSTLLIPSDAPCVAEGRGRDSHASSFSGLEPVSPESPEILVMRQGNASRGLGSPRTTRQRRIEEERERERDLERLDVEIAGSGEASPSASEDSRLLGKGLRDSHTQGSGSPRATTSQRSRNRQRDDKAARRRERREQQQRKGREKKGGAGDDSDSDDGSLMAEKEAALKRFKTRNLDECPICLELFTPESPAIFLNCGHAFHLHCTYEWLERSATCAVCGTAVTAYEEHHPEDDGDGADQEEEEEN